MLPEVGHFALIMAFCFAVLQAFAGGTNYVGKNHFLISVTRVSAFAQLVFVTLSFVALTFAFIDNDFSVVYVAENSNSSLPLIYRICAVWGAHEGSMLLWVFILSIWTALVCHFGRDLPVATLTRVLSVMGFIAIGFYLFILLTSDPFIRALPNFPDDGRDLNPLLQDPGLVSHPPMLYMGYVGMSVPFAFAISALWQGKFDASWARWARPWTTFAWSFLTLGIVLGSWWAYRELGWGGWWFWDPVENASFLPWLAATALIHSLMVTEKRDHFKSWTVLLAICAFSLSLIGTFLVRSGVLISVHAFAVDPRRGAFILEFLFAVIGVSLFLYAWRGRRLVRHPTFSIWSRESFLLANNMLFFVAMLTILLGTLYPLLVDIFHWGKISVGAPYFNMVFVPLIIPLIFLMGMGPSFYWQRRDPKSLLLPLIIIFLIAIALAIGVPLIFWHSHYQVILGLFLAFWLMLTTIYYRYQQGRPQLQFIRQWAVVFAHFGVAVTVIGVVMVSAYSEERDLRMYYGEKSKIGPYVFELQGVKSVTGPNYTAYQADMKVNRLDKPLTVLHPQFRYYSVAQSVLSKTDIHVKWYRDLYVAIGQPFEDNSWSVRIYYKPFVRWIWIGGLLMVLGGFISVIFRQRQAKRGKICLE